MSKRITYGVTGAALAIALVAIQVARAADPPPAPSPAKLDEKRQARIDQLEKYYADLYGKPVAEKNRLSQLVGLVSLSRLGGQPITTKLLSVLPEPDVLVGQMAWEALHARQAELSPADRTKWLAGGVDVARRGGFPGATIAPLIAALSERPAAEFKALGDVLARVAMENDPNTTDGKPALDAAKTAVAQWRNPKIILLLVAKVKLQPQLAGRISYILQDLPDAPETGDDPAKMQGIWGRYVRVNKPASPATRPAYAGVSGLFVKPEKIENPDDPKWRKELELPQLDLDSVDVAFCIDATWSMIVSNQYVTSYIETLTRLLRLMSDQVRGGAVYYRHETDESLMLECCRIGEQAGGFRVKTLPFTPDPKALVTLMRAQKLTGRTGHDGGAYVGGISAAMKGMAWGKKSKRIIACTGDAVATPGSEKPLVDVAEKAKADGYLLLFVVRDAKASKSVAAASKAASGYEPIVYGPDIAAQAAAAAAKKSEPSPIESFKDTAFETMTVRILELSLPESYRDRAKPLIAAVLPVLQAQDAAARASKGMAK